MLATPSECWQCSAWKATLIARPFSTSCWHRLDMAVESSSLKIILELLALLAALPYGRLPGIWGEINCFQNPRAGPR
jgi:hypothetical protein